VWCYKSAGAVLTKITNSAGAASAEKALREELLQSSRSTLEQIPFREIMLLREILG
jgi:hypothetical protein